MALPSPAEPTEPAPAGRGAWAEAGVERVADGVHRIPLPLPGDALKAVNVYAIEDGDGLTLVDAGWHSDESRAVLDAGLREAGASVSDLRRIFVTHIHHDHYGQAPALRGASGAVVLLGRGERRSFDAILEHRADAEADRSLRLERCGAADLAEEVRRIVRPGPEVDRAVWDPPDVWTDETTGLAVAGRPLRVLPTPGHTRGHVCLFDPGTGLLYAGDHVLPHITPSLGVELFADGLSLVDFISSLCAIRELPARRVLPAHGPVFDDLRTRVDELLDHHATRLDACVAAVRAGAATVLEVARRLPWTRRHRTYEELDLYNRVLAVGETAAHLHLLAVQGTLRETAPEGVLLYALPHPA